MTGPDDTFLVFNKYITPTPNAGPNGEVGFPEEVAEVLTFNLLRPTTTIDDQGTEVGLYTHGVKADALERVWRRAETDGFDVSPAATKGEALSRLRTWIDEVDPTHPDYEAQPTDWYRLEVRAAAGAGVQHTGCMTGGSKIAWVLTGAHAWLRWLSPTSVGARLPHRATRSVAR